MWMLTPFGSLWTLVALWALSWFSLAIWCIRIERSQAEITSLPIDPTNQNYAISRLFRAFKERLSGWEISSVVRRILEKIFMLPNTEEEDAKWMETKKLADEALLNLQNSTNKFCESMDKAEFKRVEKG